MPLIAKALECLGCPAADSMAGEIEDLKYLLRQASERIAWHGRGSTHYSGCELNHEDRRLLVQIELRIK